jgi:hypothetical protein
MTRTIPAVILRDFPERERGQLLHQHHEAADAAYGLAVP